MTSYQITPSTGGWSGVREQKGFTGWFWCDPDGAHVEAEPPLAWPRATHVWAWGPRAWGRWRIDPVDAPAGEPAVIGARLDEAELGTDGSVGVSVQDGRTWPAGEDRAAVSDRLRGLPIRILVLERPVQVSFLEVGAG